MQRLQQYILIAFLILATVLSGPAESATDREAEVRQIVSDFVASRTAGTGWDVRVRRVVVDGASKLPEGLIDYEVVASQQWEGWGKATMAVLARKKDKLIRNLAVQVEVDALADMVVTTRQIEHGTLISESDVALQRREISQNTVRSSRKLEEIIGKKCRTTIRANQPVRADQVEKVPLVKSGQIVTIVAENEYMRVTVTGKARSSGAEGDVIMVQNLSSFKEIPARVISATTVQVAF